MNSADNNINENELEKLINISNSTSDNLTATISSTNTNEDIVWVGPHRGLSLHSETDKINRWSIDYLYNLATRELVSQLSHLSETDIESFLKKNKENSGKEVFYPIFKAFMSFPGYIKFSEEFMIRNIKDIIKLINKHDYIFESFYKTEEYPAVVLALKLNK